MNIIERLAAEVKLKASQGEKTVQLIDEGNSLGVFGFLRLVASGGLSDDILRVLDT